MRMHLNSYYRLDVKGDRDHRRGTPKNLENRQISLRDGIASLLSGSAVFFRWESTT